MERKEHNTFMNIYIHNTGLSYLYYSFKSTQVCGVIDLEGVDMDIYLNGQLIIFNSGSYIYI